MSSAFALDLSAPDLRATTLQDALESLAARTRAGDVEGAERIVKRLASDLTEAVAVSVHPTRQQLPALLLPPLMDVWFYLRQNRCDLAAEYAARALRLTDSPQEPTARPY